MPRKANNAATTEAATATCKGKNNWKLQKKKGREKKQQQEAAAAAENVTQSQRSKANPNTPVQISVGNATHVAYEWREFMYACPTV